MGAGGSQEPLRRFAGSMDQKLKGNVCTATGACGTAYLEMYDSETSWWGMRLRAGACGCALFLAADDINFRDINMHVHTRSNRDRIGFAYAT